MTLREEQYEAIARRLDGQQVELSAEQRTVAEKVLADERRLGDLLNVPLEADVLRRVSQRLAARRRVIRLRYAATAAAVAAAAVVVLAVILESGGPKQTPPGAATAATTPVPDFTAQEEELVLLARDLDALEVEMAPSRTSEIDKDIEALQWDVSNFWSDDATPG